MSMSAKEVLQKAKDLLSDKSRWTTGVYRSRKEDGSECFCAAGALYKVCNGYEPGPLDYDGYAEAYDALAAACGGSPISANDSHEKGYDFIMAAFDRAIAKESNT